MASRPAFSDLKSTKISIQRRTFSRSTRCHFRQSFASQLLKPYGSGNKPEKGLKFRSNELSEEEIYFVFGRDPPPADFANRLLRILNGRRHDGTLDLALPEDVQEGLEEYPDAFEDGLRWLRETYPVDEDEAIMARIDREEHELERDNPSELMQRGQDLGIYKTTKDVYYGPQSGFYQAKLSDKEGDVYGVSELDKIRAENEARAAREEEELQAQIEERMAKAKTEQTKALAQRPEQSLESAQELRPPNRFEKWVMKARNRAESKLTLDSPEVAQQTTAGRLIPSFIFVTLVCGGCYILSQVWVRPKQSERLFPDVSLSFATIGSLIAINLAVFYAWRMPSFWAVLNKYFIIVPAYPYFLSMMGNLFSHQKFTHLFANMLPLVIFGLPLHEEIGRGNFLAIYLASGLIGGYASFARHAIQRVFVTSTLGASGCVYGVLTAYFALHLKYDFPWPQSRVQETDIVVTAPTFLLSSSPASGPRSSLLVDKQSSFAWLHPKFLVFSHL